MKEGRYRRTLGFLMIPIVLSFSGCAGLVGKGGALLDGSAFREKTLAYWEDPSEAGSGLRVEEVQDRGGEGFLVITLDDFPSLRINTVSPGADGNLQLISLEFLSFHERGWNEFTLDLSGGGSFKAAGARRFLQLEAMEALGISAGKIRYKDDRIGGPEALTALRNRYERIAALAEWMRDREPPLAPSDLKAFEERWKAEVLPEMVRAKKRPPLFSAAGEWVMADGAKWNTAYTQAIFPEELRPLRDSGALLRDWEEALAWVRLFYYWDYLAGALSRPVYLERRLR